MAGAGLLQVRNLPENETISLTAFKSGRFRFIWGLTSVAEAQRLGVRYLRENKDGGVQVHYGHAMVWSRGVVKMPHKNTTT